MAWQLQYSGPQMQVHAFWSFLLKTRAGEKLEDLYIKPVAPWLAELL